MDDFACTSRRLPPFAGPQKLEMMVLNLLWKRRAEEKDREDPMEVNDVCILYECGSTIYYCHTMRALNKSVN